MNQHSLLSNHSLQLGIGMSLSPLDKLLDMLLIVLVDMLGRGKIGHFGELKHCSFSF